MADTEFLTKQREIMDSLLAESNKTLDALASAQLAMSKQKIAPSPDLNAKSQQEWLRAEGAKLNDQMSQKVRALISKESKDLEKDALNATQKISQLLKKT
jgi:hypothetical protein